MHVPEHRHEIRSPAGRKRVHRDGADADPPHGWFQMERQSEIPRPSDPERRETMEREAGRESETRTKTAAGDEDRRAQTWIYGSARYPGRENAAAILSRIRQARYSSRICIPQSENVIQWYFGQLECFLFTHLSYILDGEHPKKMNNLQIQSDESHNTHHL